MATMSVAYDMSARVAISNIRKEVLDASCDLAVFVHRVRGRLAGCGVPMFEDDPDWRPTAVGMQFAECCSIVHKFRGNYDRFHPGKSAAQETVYHRLQEIEDEGIARDACALRANVKNRLMLLYGPGWSDDGKEYACHTTIAKWQPGKGRELTDEDWARVHAVAAEELDGFFHGEM